MSGYTSGNNAPTLMAQMPNRKGNAAVREQSHNKGVTAVTGKPHGMSQPKGAQGAPAYAMATNNTTSGATAGRKQAVMVSRPKDNYCGCNDGYMSSSYTK